MSQFADILDDIPQDNEREYDKTEGNHINDIVFRKCQIHGDFTGSMHLVCIDSHLPGGKGKEAET